MLNNLPSQPWEIRGKNIRFPADPNGDSYTTPYNLFELEDALKTLEQVIQEQHFDLTVEGVELSLLLLGGLWNAESITKQFFENAVYSRGYGCYWVPLELPAKNYNLIINPEVETYRFLVSGLPESVQALKEHLATHAEKLQIVPEVRAAILA